MWSAKEAREYKDWLMSSMDGRIRRLVQMFDEPLRLDGRDHLTALGKKVSRAFKDAPFSEDSPGGRRLTNAGYALAADMGLLVALYLLRAHPGTIRWETIRKPKSEVSYNLPVLEGFANGNYLDPVGGSTAEAAAILRGQRGPDAWVRVLEFWEDGAA
jgi:hypothetical protein